MRGSSGLGLGVLSLSGDIRGVRKIGDRGRLMVRVRFTVRVRKMPFFTKTRLLGWKAGGERSRDSRERGREARPARRDEGWAS